MFYVYEHIRNDTGECFYIGKGCGRRYKRSNDRTKWWSNIVNKVGYTPRIIAKNLTNEEANNFEVLIIKKCKENGIKLINQTNGGGGIVGYKHTKEAKEKIKNAQIGKIVSKESIEKVMVQICGANHFKAIKVEYQGVVYGCVKDLAIATDVKRKTIYERLKANPSKWGYKAVK
jgi:hypothetical protein